MDQSEGADQLAMTYAVGRRSRGRRGVALWVVVYCVLLSVLKAA